METAEIKKYLYGIRFYIFFSFLLFLASTWSGYILANDFPKETGDIISNMKSYFSPAKEMTSFGLFMFIFENNVTKLLMVLVFSFILGLAPLLAMVSNGLILGIIAYVTSKTLSWSFFLAGVLPHGLLEIPVLITSMAIGLRIGKVAAFRVFGKKDSLTEEFAKGLKFYFLVLVPMLFAAALIEVYITPAVLFLFR